MFYICDHEHTGKSPVDHHTQKTLLCHMRKRFYILDHEQTGKSPEDHHTTNT